MRATPRSVCRASARPAPLLVATLLTAVAVALLAIATWPRPAAARDVPVADNSMIAITGIARSTAKDSFRLKYGEHSVLVQIEKSPRYTKERDKLHRKKVTVYGRLDRDFLNREQINAVAVYVHESGQTFQTDGTDGTGLMHTVDQLRHMPEVGTMGIAGVLREKDGDSLTLTAGGESIKVDTSELPDKATRLESLKLGHGVIVHATIKKDDDIFGLFKGPALKARSVAPLKQGSTT